MLHLMLHSARVSLAAALLVTGFTQTALAGGAMTLDRGSLHRFAPANSMLVEAAGNSGDVVCVAGTKFRVDLYVSCDPTLATRHEVVAPGSYTNAHAVGVTPTTVTVAGCHRSRSVLDYSAFVLRTSHDGALDPAFGSGGTASVDVPGFASECVNTVDMLDDGRILLMGTARVSEPRQGRAVPTTSWLARLQPDGRIDTTFGTGGFTVLRAPLMETTYGYDSAMLDDGTILTVGFLRPSSGRPTAASIATDEDGHLRADYGSNGIVIYPTGRGASSLSSIARRSTGRPGFPAAASGSYNLDGLVRPIVVRISSNGSRVPGRGTGVTTKLPVTLYGGDEQMHVLPIVEGPDGIVTMAGERPTPFDYDSFITQLSSTDKLLVDASYLGGIEPFDTTRGQDGEYVIDLLATPSGPMAVGMTKDHGASVGQLFSASRPAPQASRRASLRFGTIGGPQDDVATCGSSQRSPCRVAARAAFQLVGRIGGGAGPNVVDPLAAVTAHLHQLSPDGVKLIWEVPMRLARGRSGPVWIMQRRLPRGEYIASMRRDPGRRSGAMESNWVWLNVGTG